MTELGKIERIQDLRTIWPHETNDFSKWLANDENLILLSDAVGIDIKMEERESSVGIFNVDIYASEANTDRKIIIENQLEDTDHDHLGKIITYASGKGAEVIIWIVKHARDEHKQAIEWLNQHTDENIGFFLLEIELWKINDSLPAPKFNIVEKPNDWAKTIKKLDSISDTQKLQLEFWQAFNDYAFRKAEFSRTFSKHKPQPQNWYDLSIGIPNCYIELTVNTQKNLIGTDIYISNDKEKFKKFEACREQIEIDLGMKLEWREASKDCRILAVRDGDIAGCSTKWTEYFDWMCNMAFKLKEIINKYGY